MTAEATDRAYRRTERQEHHNEAAPTLGASTVGEVSYHRRQCSSWVGCNQYAKGIFAVAKAHWVANMAINGVLSSGNTAAGILLIIQVTKFAALCDKCVSLTLKSSRASRKRNFKLKKLSWFQKVARETSALRSVGVPAACQVILNKKARALSSRALRVSG